MGTVTVARIYRHLCLMSMRPWITPKAYRRCVQDTLKYPAECKAPYYQSSEIHMLRRLALRQVLHQPEEVGSLYASSVVIF